MRWFLSLWVCSTELKLSNRRICLDLAIAWATTSLFMTWTDLKMILEQMLILCLLGQIETICKSRLKKRKQNSLTVCLQNTLNQKAFMMQTVKRYKSRIMMSIMMNIMTKMMKVMLIMTTHHRYITFNMNMMSLGMMFSTFKKITRKNFQPECICGLPVLSRFHIQTNRHKNTLKKSLITK